MRMTGVRGGGGGKLGVGGGRVPEGICPTVRNHSHQCPGCPLVSLLLGFMVPSLGWMQTRPLVILYFIMALAAVLLLLEIYINL